MKHFSFGLLAYLAFSGCVTSSSGVQRGDELADPNATSLSENVAIAQRVQNRQIKTNIDGIIRNSDDIAVALDPLTDRLMFEKGFNGAIVSGPDNNAFVILLFETGDDMEKFKRDIGLREDEFRKMQGQWHFNYSKKGQSQPKSQSYVRVKFDIEQFEEDNEVL